MRRPGWLIGAALVVGIAGPSPAGEVRLAMRDGLVTLEARDATLREVFAEWSRVGQARVVNAERLAGGPVTLQLTDVPERQALETLLRSSAGFIAAPRPVLEPALSVYDRVVLMPGERPAVVPLPGPGAAAAIRTVAPRDRVVALPMPAGDEEEEAGQDQAAQVAPVPGVQRPGLPAGAPYAPIAGPSGQAQAPQPAPPAASPRPGLPTAPGPPIKQEGPR